MDVQSIRGTHDILPGSVELWQRIEETARRLFALYGFAEIRTPIFEETELFARSIGSETDIVQKEMYSFEDVGGRSLTLRPEGTAPVVRAYVENRLYASGEAAKLFYLGPMFRRERPQKGRYRQFHQIGAEVLGTDHPAVEAEVIDFLCRFLREMQMEDYRLLVNSVGCANCRPDYVRGLRADLTANRSTLCSQCRRRSETNPLRVFDCKVPGCQPVIDSLPKIVDALCADCQGHFESFLEYLKIQGIPFEKEPRLVRGLDYYVKTTFEIVSDRLGPTQNALLGGGRYDGLSEALGGIPTKGFGFAMGMERFVLLLAGRDRLQGEYRVPPPQVFLAYLEEDSLKECIRLAAELRRHGIFSYVDFQSRGLRGQLRLANRLQSLLSCTIGENERATGIIPVKRMSDGTETRVRRTDLANFLAREIQAAIDASSGD